MSYSNHIPSAPAEFNTYLKQFCIENESKKLHLDDHLKTILQYVKTLIIQLPVESPEKAQVVNNLSSLVFLLDHSIENNRFFNDPKLLNGIFAYSNYKPFEHSPYVIITTYLRGEFLSQKSTLNNNNNDSFKLFFQVLLDNNNVTFLNNISVRFLKNLEQTTAGINFQFLISLFTVATYTANLDSSLYLLGYTRDLDLGIIFRRVIFEYKLLPLKTYGPTIKSSVQILEKLFMNLRAHKFDLATNPLYVEMLNTIYKGLKELAYFNTAGLTPEQIAANLGFTNNPVEYLSKKYDSLTLSNCYSFIKGQHIYNEFKAKVHKQHMLMGTNERKYPVYQYLFEISSMLQIKFFRSSNPSYSDIKKFRSYTDEMLLALLDKSLDYWEKSKATQCSEDFYYIVGLLKIDLQFLNSALASTEFFNEAIDLLNAELTYEKVKQSQLKFLKDDQYMDYLNSNDFNNYNSELLESVKLFVINERLMELTKGMLCHSENPFEAGKGSMMFISISPKRNSLIYVNLPENFDPKTLNGNTHDILDAYDSKQVVIRSIKKIVSEKILKNKLVLNSLSKNRSYASSESLQRKLKNHVVISSRNVITKISLLDRSNHSLLSFYTDTNRSATLWCDTINLLIDNFQFSKITNESKEQVEQLFDIKKTLQYLPLAPIFNNRIIDLYANNADVGPQDSNFLSIKNINFNDETKNLKNLIKKTELRENAIEEGKEVCSDKFEYTYDELIGLTKDFYYY